MESNNTLKISPNELRIGNYVASKFVEEYFVQIGGITDEYPILLTVTFEQTLWDELEPIPIDGDWMLKFGFRIGDNEFIKNGIIFEVDRLSPTLTLRLKGSNCNIIEYVHQLQNLYYALTEDELLLRNYEREF